MPRKLLRTIMTTCLTISLLFALVGCSSNEPAVNDEVLPPADSEPTTPAPEEDPALGELAVELVKIASDFDQPVYVTGAGDDSGRLFVAEKTGRIWIMDENGEREPEPFLSISNRIATNSERGLLGLAFPEGFDTPGDPLENTFVIHYSNGNGDTVVSSMRVRADGDNSADTDSEEVILTAKQPYSNHNGGMIEFGPDGHLYIGLGDGGSGGDPEGNGQDRGTLLGSILRLEVPFGDTAQPEVWAWGLRNPWRFSFDRDTGDLWIGDVGQNEWEEIDFLAAADIPGDGYNFGWNVMEGTRPYPDGPDPEDTSVFTAPLIEYDHSAGNSVTGGYVYRGDEFPQMQGVYFYGDWGSGRLWGLRINGDSADNAELLDTSMQIVSFGEDDDGELYLVDMAGTIYRIVQK